MTRRVRRGSMREQASLASCVAPTPFPCEPATFSSGSPKQYRLPPISYHWASVRGGRTWITSADLSAFMIGTNQGPFRALNDNRIQFALPESQHDLVGESQPYSFWVEDFREARIVKP